MRWVTVLIGGRPDIACGLHPQKTIQLEGVFKRLQVGNVCSGKRGHSGPQIRDETCGACSRSGGAACADVGCAAVIASKLAPTRGPVVNASFMNTPDPCGSELARDDDGSASTPRAAQRIARRTARGCHDTVAVFKAWEIASPSRATWGALTSVLWVPGRAVTFT